MMTPLMIVTAETQREKSQRVPERYVTEERKHALAFQRHHLPNLIKPDMCLRKMSIQKHLLEFQAVNYGSISD